jgi:hypothetical protein
MSSHGKEIEKCMKSTKSGEKNVTIPEKHYLGSCGKSWQ